MGRVNEDSDNSVRYSGSALQFSTIKLAPNQEQSFVVLYGWTLV